MAASDAEIKDLLDRSLGHVEVAELISQYGYTTSEASVRRYREKSGWEPSVEEAPPGWSKEAELDSDGNGMLCSGPLEAPITDPAELLKLWNMDPTSIEIVGNMGIKMWQMGIKSKKAIAFDTDGKASDWDTSIKTKNMFAYKVAIRKKAITAIPASLIESWRTALQTINWIPGDSLWPDKVSYAVLIADPQLGKERTSEAIFNWKRGVVEHAERIQRLVDSGVNVEVAAMFMGDETEGVANNYCVGAEELVLTKGMEWVPAGKLIVGEELYALEEEKASNSGRRYAPAQVTACEIKELPAVRIRFSDGTSLVCTPEHPVLARPTRTHSPAVWRWVRADALMAPRDVRHPNFDRKFEICKIADPWVTPDTYQVGWMGGLFDGEGCLSGNGDREAPYGLTVSQKEGLVLDQARKILGAYGFEFSESKPGAPGVVSLKVLGGYAEVLRALGTFQPKRLIAKLGHPYLYPRANVFADSVEDIGVQPIAVMSTSARTYFANGIASHNSNQAHTIEMNLTEQLELDFDMTMWTLKTLLPLGQRRLVGSVRSNHGEWTRNGSKDVVTTKADNSSTFIRAVAQKTFTEIPGYEDVEWLIGNEGPHVLADLSGVSCFFSHFYEQKGKGGAQEIRTRSAIERQIIGRTEELGGVKIFYTAHFHHFYSQVWEGRSQFGCPALEAEKSSGYMLNQYGVWSPPGMLGMVVGKDVGGLGWADLNVF